MKSLNNSHKWKEKYSIKRQSQQITWELSKVFKVGSLVAYQTRGRKCPDSTHSLKTSND